MWEGEKNKRPNQTENGDPEEECWRIGSAVLAAVEHAFGAPDLSSTSSSQPHFPQLCCRQNWQQIHNCFPALSLL